MSVRVRIKESESERDGENKKREWKTRRYMEKRLIRWGRDNNNEYRKVAEWLRRNENILYTENEPNWTEIWVKASAVGVNGL